MTEGSKTKQGALDCQAPFNVSRHTAFYPTVKYLNERARVDSMQTGLKVLFTVLAIALFSIALAGCAGKNLTLDAKAAEIDDGLRDGPVLVEFGAEWCGWCEKEKPVIEQLSRDFKGVTFVSVDVDVNGTLADNYYVEGVPQLNLIVKKNSDGSYLYIDPYGEKTTDRFRSRIVGYREYDELRPLIEAAIAAR